MEEVAGVQEAEEEEVVLLLTRMVVVEVSLQEAKVR